MIQKIDANQQAQPSGLRETLRTDERKSEGAGSFGSVLRAAAGRASPTETEGKTAPPEDEERKQDPSRQPAAALAAVGAAAAAVETSAPGVPAAQGTGPVLQAGDLSAATLPGLQGALPQSAAQAERPAQSVPAKNGVLPAEEAETEPALSAAQTPPGPQADALPQGAAKPGTREQDTARREIPAAGVPAEDLSAPAAPAGAEAPAAFPQAVRPGSGPQEEEAAGSPAARSPGKGPGLRAEARIPVSDRTNGPADGTPKLPDPAGAEREKTSRNGGAVPPEHPAAQAAGLYTGGKVVVRVSDEAAPAVPAAPDQVAQAAAAGLKAGKKEFSMDLYPRSLGKVSVRMTAESGVLTVEISASDPRTQSLLLSGADEIKAILQQTAGRGDEGRAVQIRQPEVPWYEQGRQNGGARQQPRDDDGRQQSERAARYAALNPAGMGTGDFLSLIQLTGT